MRATTIATTFASPLIALKIILIYVEGYEKKKKKPYTNTLG